MRAAGLLIATESRLRLEKLRRRSLDIRPFLKSTVPIAGRRRTVDPEQVILAVNRVSRTLGIGTCLSRALVSARLLRGRGSHVVVRVGVRKDGDRLVAHAWVEGPSVVFSEGNGPRGHAPLILRGPLGTLE